jgi:hypothetical protein
MKNVNTKHIICLIVLLLQNTFSFAQETIQQYKSRLTAHELRQVDFARPINITSGEDGKYTIIFSDANKGQIIKTFDIRENNPFAELGSKTDDAYRDIYLFENKSTGDVFPKMNLENYVGKEMIKETMKIEGIYLVYGAQYSENRQFAAVTYSAYSLPGLVCRSKVLLFDSTSTVLNMHTIDLNIGTIIITDDGNYFAITSGWLDMEVEKMRINDGFMVLCAKTGKVILYKEVYNISGIYCEGNLIVAGTHYYVNDNGSKMDYRYYVDTKNNKMYSREFNLEGLQAIETKPDGLTLQYRSGNAIKLEFLGDFKVEDIE